jgi:predicted Co/Zn/Cd cation transporter (cation efflux family)
MYDAKSARDQHPFWRRRRLETEVDIEIDFPVGAAVRAIADSDTVRQDLNERLAVLGDERSVVVTFTADRRWAA